MSLEEKCQELKKQFQETLSKAISSKDIEALRGLYFGKKGLIQELVALLRECPPEKKPQMGKEINLVKEELESLCTQALHGFSLKELEARLLQEKIDITLPARARYEGRKHPITLMMDEILGILKTMGFSVQWGPDIDSDYYNYEGLNFPEDHPAREMQDTFYLTPKMLLRSHTSNTQLRVMEQHKPPLRVVAPGTVYRNEDVSARSHVFFHQVEILCVDKGVSFSDLFATLEAFLEKLFKRKIKTRFRPSFFPFVEPGLEIDIECLSCGNKGCRLCKESGWLEIAGAGMVHPEVLKNGGIDPEEYSGYAAGMGIERLAMLRYGIQDIRLFAENDLRFLSQFSG